MRRLPAIGDPPITASWHDDDVNSDDKGMIGPSERLAELFYATGFSGHAFLRSTAVGGHLVELIGGRPATIDLSELRAERFADASGAWREPIVI